MRSIVQMTYSLTRHITTVPAITLFFSCSAVSTASGFSSTTDLMAEILCTFRYQSNFTSGIPHFHPEGCEV